MEQFEQIRRDRERQGLSIRALAERHGVHRRAVRAALESAVPPPKRTPVGRSAPKLGAYRELIDEAPDVIERVRMVAFEAVAQLEHTTLAVQATSS